MKAGVIAMLAALMSGAAAQSSGVITGVITDEDGDPVANLTVEAIAAPGTVPSRVRKAVSDDRGVYRIWGVPPGRYFVSASLTNLDIARRALDVMPMTTYYPGVASMSLAQPVTLAPGAEIEGINLVARFGRYSELTVDIRHSSGQLATGSTLFVSAIGGEPALQAASAAPAGGFVVPRLAAGDYHAVAITNQGATWFTASGTATVSGDGRPVTLQMVSVPAARASGRIVSGAAHAPLSYGQLRVVAEPPDESEPAAIVAARDQHLAPAADGRGRFAIAVLPGARVLGVIGLPPGWALRSVRIGGREQVDGVVEFRSGVLLSGIEIEITDALGNVTGNVIGPTAEPIVAVLMTRDPAQWTRGGRSVLSSPIDGNGAFTIRGARPGAYAIGAVPAESFSLTDASSLHAILQKATPITIEAGGTVNVSLRIIR